MLRARRPGKIAQVLTNLLDNAIKFTESGWVRLIVTSAHHFGDRVSIRFEVHDSGIGVSKDQERRLYLAFSQVAPAEPAYLRRIRGLGLAISQQLVTTMGGAIGLSSAPGTRAAPSASPCVSPCRRAGPTSPARARRAEGHFRTTAHDGGLERWRATHVRGRSLLGPGVLSGRRRAVEARRRNAMSETDRCGVGPVTSGPDGPVFPASTGSAPRPVSVSFVALYARPTSAPSCCSSRPCWSACR